MKLSELVEYKNQLDGMDAIRCHQQCRHQLDAIMHAAVNNRAVSWPKLNKGMHHASNELDRAFEQFLTSLDHIRTHAQQLITEQEADCFRESTRLWRHEMPSETDGYILNRKLESGEITDQEIRGKLLRWSDWQFPAAVIRPARESWIDHLVALDPLYLIDQRQSLLQPAIDRFPQKYQNRLRIYEVSEAENQQMLTALPDSQFALFFAYNFFHFRPFEVICKWISEIYAKLRPGGILFFTFNDCDFSQGVGLYENHFMCYTPGHLLVQHATQAGFTVVERRQAEGNVSWLELQKPGKLKSMRAGQTLAKIVAKSK